MTDEEMIFDEQIEQETVPEEVENYEEQTEQGATSLSARRAWIEKPK